MEHFNSSSVLLGGPDLIENLVVQNLRTLFQGLLSGLWICCLINFACEAVKMKVTMISGSCPAADS